jgi:hypothetical protein
MSTIIRALAQRAGQGEVDEEKQQAEMRKSTLERFPPTAAPSKS